MTRAEIIEGLREIHDRFYAFIDYRKTLEACLELLEKENDVIDRVLEIIEELSFGGVNINYDLIKSRVLSLRGEQE
ncbi:MAG: hypothetical protein IJR00_08175 [Lachnospiraceae bacterium]|nr:hypothetical protein [Lachnospiraceae bacterium]